MGGWWREGGEGGEVGAGFLKVKGFGVLGWFGRGLGVH